MAAAIEEAAASLAAAANKSVTTDVVAALNDKLGIDMAEQTEADIAEAASGMQAAETTSDLSTMGDKEGTP